MVYWPEKDEWVLQVEERGNAIRVGDSMLGAGVGVGDGEVVKE